MGVGVGGGGWVQSVGAGGGLVGRFVASQSPWAASGCCDCLALLPLPAPPLLAAGNKDKKLAALDIVNVSIKAYFRLNTLRLCKNLTRTVESRQFAPWDAFPAAQRVTYRFYVGRLAVFDENYVRRGVCSLCLWGGWMGSVCGERRATGVRPQSHEK